MPERVRLRWARSRETTITRAGRQAREWFGCDDAGNAVARVIHLDGPIITRRGLVQAIPLDRDEKLIRLLPRPQAGGDWLAVIGDRVVGRAGVPLEAVRWAEAALAG